MKFKYTILYVLNVEETLKFYTQAFGFAQSMIHESGDYGELNTGSTTLSFSSLDLMTNIGKNPGQASSSNPVFEIAFETTDVPLALEKAMNAGATLIQKTQEMPWGQTTAYVSDKNGFLIELCTPISAQS